MGRDKWILNNLSYLASFNPRARMGRDVNTSIPNVATLEFQPTRPHGARLELVSSFRGSNTVSTHAPAWGATHECSVCFKSYFCFNPRARMGRDEDPIPLL